MIPVIVKLCESPSRAGGLLMINYEIRGDDRSHYVAYVDDNRPFLWKPTVVEAILRNKLNLIVKARCQQLKGKNVDIPIFIESTAKDLQNIRCETGVE